MRKPVFLLFFVLVIALTLKYRIELANNHHHVVAGDQSYAWDFRPYFREGYCEKHKLLFKSKNDLAIEMIAAFPAAPDEIVYVLMDSWYTSQKMLDACNTRGFHVIAAVKANRKICPAGVKPLFDILRELKRVG